MRRFFLLKVLFSSLVLMLIGGCLSQAHLPPPRTGDFCGRVQDSLTGEVVPKTMVTIGETQVSTDQEGRFLFPMLAPGEYQVHLERSWYLSAKVNYKHVGKSEEQLIQLTPLPLHGKLLYTAAPDGKNWDIYQLDLATRIATRLTNTSADETEPVRLGQRLFYVLSDGVAKNKLVAHDLNNGQLQFLAESGKGEESPTVDQTGEILVFKSYRTSPGEIFANKLTTGESFKITKGSSPALSPDGKQLAYINGDQLYLYELSKVGQTGYQGRQLTMATDNLKVDHPCWDATGKRFLVDAKNTLDNQRYIYLVEVGETNVNLQQLTVTTTGRDEDHRHPCWSADGQMIFFSASILYKGRTDLYCFKLAEALADRETTKWLMLTSGSGSKKEVTLDE